MKSKPNGWRKLCVSVMASLLFFGCILSLSMHVPFAEAGGEVPSPTGSQYAYWHWEAGGDTRWANTNAGDDDDSGNTTWEVTVSAAEIVSYEFVVKANMGDDPALAPGLYFKNNGVVNGRVRLDLTVSGGGILPDKLTFFTAENDGSTRLNSWPLEVGYRPDGTYQLYIEMDEVEIPVGHIFSVGVSFEAQPGTTTVTLLTGGESYYVLPLIEGSDGGDGGNSGNGENGDTTDDSDDDDDSYLMPVIGIVVIVIIIAAVLVLRKR